MSFSIDDFLKENATATEWQLSMKGLTYADAVKVAAALATNSTVTKLDLGGECGMPCVMLCRRGGGALSCECVVEVRGFDVCVYVRVCGSGNNIGDEGGSAIGGALATNSTLKELNLYGECDVVCVMLC